MNRPPTVGPEANFYDPGSFDATAYNAGFEDGIAQADARAASQERPQPTTTNLTSASTSLVDGPPWDHPYESADQSMACRHCGWVGSYAHTAEFYQKWVFPALSGVQERPPIDVERLGFRDLLDVADAILRNYPPDTIVCSHLERADIGAQTTAAIADLVASARLSGSVGEP